MYAWNIRGFNKSHKHRDVIDFIAVNRVSLLCLVETKVSQVKVGKIMRKFGVGWEYVL